MHDVGRLRRAIVIAGLLAAVALAAAVARAWPHEQRAFHAHRLVVKVDCRGGLVAEKDGRCSRAGSVEGPVETFTSAEQRAMKQTAPFQTVAPGAYANAMAQRGKKPKTGNAWQPIGNTPLWANSPDYAG